MEKLNFEEALAKLEQIIKELESGNIELNKAIDKYTEDERTSKRNYFS